MKKVKNPKKDLAPAKKSAILLRLMRLMRSLTQAQKRDFKKYVKFWGASGGLKYLRLFELLSKFIQADKDEDQLTEYLLHRKKFGSQPAELGATALYLYKKLLESQRTTPEGAPHLVRLNAYMQDILFLYNKNLLTDCLPLIEEARELARALDKPAYELELLLWERRSRANERIRQPEQYFQQQRREEARLLRQIEQFNLFNGIAYELGHVVSARQPVPESLEAEITPLLEDLRAGRLVDLSPRLKVRLYYTLVTYHELKHTHTGSSAGSLVKQENLRQSLYYQELMLDAYRANRFFLEEEQTQYFAALEGYLNRCIRLGENQKAESHMALLETEKNDFLICRTVHYTRIQHFIKQNEFRQACQYIAQRNMAGSIERFKNRFSENRLLALRFTCGQAFFCFDDFDRASEWFGQVAAMRPDVRPDAVWLCRLLEIICLYEVGVYRTELNPVRPLVNYGRALRRAKKYFSFDEKLLDAVGMVFRNPRALTKAGLPECLAELKNEFDRTPARYLTSLVLAWLEARLNRSSLVQEIRKYQ